MYAVARNYEDRSRSAERVVVLQMPGRRQCCRYVEVEVDDGDFAPRGVLHNFKCSPCRTSRDGGVSIRALRKRLDDDEATRWWDDGVLDRKNPVSGPDDGRADM